MQIALLKHSIIIYLCTFFIFINAKANTTITLPKAKTLKIVNASNVRVRSAPTTDASIVKKLSFGTLVKVERRTSDQFKVGTNSDYWYYLNEHKAWIFGQLLTDFQPEKAASIQSALIEKRLKKSLKFKEYVELSEYIKQISGDIDDVDIKGRLALNDLIALEKAAEKIEWGQETKEPYVTFLKQRKDLIFYAEIAGQYIINPDAYWDLSEKYADNPVGDDMTWYAANAMSGGECEGMTYCMLMRALGNEGEYLRRYPEGKYSKMAIKVLSQDYQYVIENNFGKNAENYSKREQADLRKEERILDKALKKMGKNLPQAKKLRKQLKAFGKLFYR